MNQKPEESARNLFSFEAENSLSLVGGVVSGIVLGGLTNKETVLTGLVMVTVITCSMWKWKAGKPKETAIVILLSNLMAGMIPVIPYIVLPTEKAMSVSVFLTALSLFVLGVFDGWRKGVHPTKEGARIAALGGLTMGAGMLVGWLLGFR